MKNLIVPLPNLNAQEFVEFYTKALQSEVYIKAREEKIKRERVIARKLNKIIAQKYTNNQLCSNEIGKTVPKYVVINDYINGAYLNKGQKYKNY